MRTKAQQRSIDTIKSYARIIQEEGTKELKRSSQKRRKALVNSWSTITTHTYKLELDVPVLSFRYLPQNYLDNTKNIMDQLEQKGYLEEVN